MKTISITILLTSSLSIAAEGQTTAPPASGAAEELTTVASRFLADGLDDRVLLLKQRLAINKQDRGPFGLYQILGKSPILSGPISKLSRKTPFNEFINSIRISVINPKEKEFLVGARIFRLGQVFPIVRAGERLSVRVESVSRSQVAFKNLDTGEVALRRLNFVPDGVTASAGSIDVRGVTPSGRGEVEPLHLDFDSPPPTP
ncbi:MAG: hypothetical protein VCA35_05955 [Roseibacillus sp.]